MTLLPSGFLMKVVERKTLVSPLWGLMTGHKEVA